MRYSFKRWTLLALLGLAGATALGPDEAQAQLLRGRFGRRARPVYVPVYAPPVVVTQERYLVTPPTVVEREYIQSPTVETRVVQPPPVVERQVVQPPPIVERRVVQPPPVVQTRVVRPPAYEVRRVLPQPPIVERRVVQPGVVDGTTTTTIESTPTLEDPDVQPAGIESPPPLPSPR